MLKLSLSVPQTDTKNNGISTLATCCNAIGQTTIDTMVDRISWLWTGMNNMYGSRKVGNGVLVIWIQYR